MGGVVLEVEGDLNSELEIVTRTASLRFTLRRLRRERIIAKHVGAHYSNVDLSAFFDDDDPNLDDERDLRQLTAADGRWRGLAEARSFRGPVHRLLPDRLGVGASRPRRGGERPELLSAAGVAAGRARGHRGRDPVGVNRGHPRRDAGSGRCARRQVEPRNGHDHRGSPVRDRAQRQRGRARDADLLARLGADDRGAGGGAAGAAAGARSQPAAHHQPRLATPPDDRPGVLRGTPAGGSRSDGMPGVGGARQRVRSRAPVPPRAASGTGPPAAGVSSCWTRFPSRWARVAIGSGSRRRSRWPTRSSPSLRLPPAARVVSSRWSPAARNRTRCWWGSKTA